VSPISKNSINNICFMIIHIYFYVFEQYLQGLG